MDGPTFVRFGLGADAQAFNVGNIVSVYPTGDTSVGYVQVNDGANGVFSIAYPTKAEAEVAVEAFLDAVGNVRF